MTLRIALNAVSVVAWMTLLASIRHRGKATVLDIAVDALFGAAALFGLSCI